MHAAARGFLTARGLVGRGATRSMPAQVFFELTKEEKVARVAALGLRGLHRRPAGNLGDAGLSRRHAPDPVRSRPTSSPGRRATVASSSAVSPGQRSQRMLPVSAAEATLKADDRLLALADALTAHAGLGRATGADAARRRQQQPGLSRRHRERAPLVLKRYFSDPARHPRPARAPNGDFCKHAWSRGVRGVPRAAGLRCDADRPGSTASSPGRKLTRCRTDARACRCRGRFRARRQCRARAAATGAGVGSLLLASPITSRRWSAASRVWRRSMPRRRMRTRHNASYRRAAAGLGCREGSSRTTVARAAGLGIDLQAPLAADECCLSPSDFGFHNALADDDAARDLPRFRICRPRRSGQARLRLLLPAGSAGARWSARGIHRTAGDGSAWTQPAWRAAASCSTPTASNGPASSSTISCRVGAARRAFAEAGAWASRCAAQLEKAEAKLAVFAS